MPSEYAFSNDTARLDRDLVHTWLAERSCWAKDRPRAVQDAAFASSRNYSVHSADGRQVAYARVVTDTATFAWLCDVFVDESVRGDGIGKMLVSGVLDDLQQFPITRVMLATADAHGLYARYGFAPSDDPERYMILHMPPTS